MAVELVKQVLPTGAPEFGQVLRWFLAAGFGLTIAISLWECSTPSKIATQPSAIDSMGDASPLTRNSETRNALGPSPTANAASWNQLEYNTALPYFEIARRKDQAQDYASAIANYQRGIAIFPAAIDERGCLGIEFLRIDKENDAEKSWRDALALAASRSRDWPNFGILEKGDALFRNRNFKAAFEEYLRTIKAQIKANRFDPATQDSGALNSLEEGLGRAQDGRFEGASEKFKSALQQSPYFEEVYYFLGDALLASGHKAEAISEWEGVLTHGFRNQTVHGPDIYQMSALQMLIRIID